MKKYLKTSAVMLTASILFGSAGALLLKGAQFSSDNTTLLKTFNNDSQYINARTADGVDNMEMIHSINGGGNFAIARDTTNGDRAYGWGFNKDGELGLGDVNSRNVPTLIESFPKKSAIKWIKGGSQFTLAIIEDNVTKVNTMWATGINAFGVFGNNNQGNTPVLKFTLVHTFPKAVDNFAVGNNHAGVVSCGELFMWGRNNNGQLGFGPVTDNQLVPKKVDYFLTTQKLGELKLSDNSSFISVLNDDNSIKEVCAWGYNITHQLGIEDGISKNIPTPITYIFTGKLTNFYPGISRVYFTTYDSASKKYYVYGSGYGNYSTLGTGIDNGSSSMFAIDKIGSDNSVEVVNIFLFLRGTFLVTAAGDAYSCGDYSAPAIGANKTVFVKSVLSEVTYIYGAGSFEGESNMYAVMRNKLYAWGSNDYGGYGNGTTVSTLHNPGAIDPFNPPTVITQIKTENNTWAADAVKGIYNETTGINNANFSAYLDMKKFPLGTTFTMTKAPNVLNLDGIIECTVQPDKFYTDPDGAKSISVAPFVISLTGFKAFPDSKIENKTLAANSKYNLNNIVNEMQTAGSNLVNMETFNDLFATSNFPNGSIFTIIESKVEGTTYTLKINASVVQLDGLVAGDQPFDLTFPGLPAYPDSYITPKALPAGTFYNLNNIVNEMQAGGTNVNMTTFNNFFTLENFPANPVFTIVKSTIVGEVYQATLSANDAQLNGYLVHEQPYDLSIIGLQSRPDSSVIILPLDKDEVNAIIESLVVDQTISQETIGKLIDLNEFPSGTQFIINAVDNKSSTYPSFEFTPDKIYKAGYIVANDTPTKLSFTVDYTPPPVISSTADPNQGLIIGLSVGGVILLLILVGLIISYLKNKRRHSYGDYESILL